MTESPVAPDTVSEGPPTLTRWPSRLYAWFTVVVLTIAAMLSYIDRLIFSLLIEPIRLDLGINDIQVSLVGATAFALFYGLFVIPMGYLADRWRRTNIIAVGIVAWSFLTAACGLAQSFWQLFVARLGVGVGEASLAGAGYSLVADSFRERELPLAMSVYVSAAIYGSGLAMIAGGAVVDFTTSLPEVAIPVVGVLKPWQLAFIVVGLPGVLVGALVYFIKEPQRKGKISTMAGATVGLNDALTFLKRNWRVYAPHYAGFAIVGMYAYSIFIWIPTFLMRTYGWTAGEAGVRFGTVVLVAGVSGCYAGGWTAGWLTRRGHLDASMRTALYGLIALLPVSAIATLMPTPTLGLAALFPVVFCFSLAAAVAPTAIQIVTPNELRGFVSSLFSFTSILVGLGGGPTLVAVVTEVVLADRSLIGYSISMVGVVTVLVAVTIIAAALPAYRRAAAEARQWKDT